MGDSNREALLPDVSAWHAESFRFTVFWNQAAQPEEFKRWRDIVGQVPENVNLNRRNNILIENGEVEDTQLTLNMAGLRHDLHLLPPEADGEVEPDPTSFSVIGGIDETRKYFLSFVDTWLDGMKHVARIAFGTVLLQPVEDLADGYVLVDRYLPRVDLGTDSTDFLYQINRRRKSVTCEGQIINRMSKWSVARKGGFQLLLTGGPTQGRSIEGAFAARLELDVNTAPLPEGQSLPVDRLKHLTHELADLAAEIAIKGDIE